MTTRQIALSNLSLLPGSLFRGPEKTWEIAQKAGFDGMKINPLREWDAGEVRYACIPVLAFEGPWRNPYSFQTSFQVLLKGDLMGFVADTIFFGSRADTRARLYAQDFPEAVGINCPPHYGQNPNFVRETDFKNWPDILDTNTPVCLDTWHIRDYPDNSRIFNTLIATERIKTIDVQTRSYKEIKRFLIGSSTALEWQLSRLAVLPRSVSASMELLPQHLWRLQKELHLNRIAVLSQLRERVQKCLR